ncbi:MAG: hypothetical protein JNN22_16630 [Rhodospirillales bacterium]|nr:hypothetical protein [Rhodospirillales bacterium]
MKKFAALALALSLAAPAGAFAQATPATPATPAKPAAEQAAQAKAKHVKAEKHTEKQKAETKVQPKTN